MAKIAAMPLYGKNLKKSFSSEPLGCCLLNFVYSIRYLSIIEFAKMNILGWPWFVLQQG